MAVEILGSGEDPFKPTPDPRYLYFNEERQKTYESLVSDIRGGRRCMLLVGGSGMGKTTLLWKLRQDLGESDFHVIFPSYTRLSYQELLETCRDLGAEGLGERNGHGVAPSAEEEEDSGGPEADQKPYLILIDEAQVVSDGALEQLCQLCEEQQDPRAQVLFAGQPQLVERLSASEIAAARSCAEASYVLDRLDDLDTTAYIHHRLSVAGTKATDVFESQATDRVARLAGGIPRLINRLSGTSLRMARDQDVATVSPDIVDLAAAICDPVPNIEGAMALFGDADADEAMPPDEQKDDALRDEASPDELLPLLDQIGVPSALDPAKGQARAEAPAEEPETGDEGSRARQLAARILGSAPKAPWLTFKAGGFVIGVLIGAAVMVGFLLSANSPGDSIMDRLNLAELWRSVPTPPDSDPLPTAKTAGSSAEAIKASRAVPSILAAAANGPEDQALDLNIDVSLRGSQDAANMTVEISGLPEGGRLSTGRRQGDGSWHLDSDEIAGLQFIPEADFSGRFVLEVSATSQESGARASSANVGFASTRLPVSVTAVADRPRLGAADAGGKAKEPIALAIEAGLSDLDGSETLGIEIHGLPAGYDLSAGARSEDGIWTLPSDRLAGLTVTPPLAANGTVELEVRAVAQEADGDRAVAVAKPTLLVEANVQKPVLAIAQAEGREDSPIALEIGVTTQDVRGTDALTIDLIGVPQGAGLSAGRVDQAGVWHLQAEQLSGLSVTPPANYSGRFELSVAAGVPGFAESVATATLDVAVSATADQPNLSVGEAKGREDQSLPLNITAELADSDGSEELVLHLSGLPAGARLSAGAEEGEKGWHLQPEDLIGLTLVPAANESATFDLTITARSREAGGDEAVRTVNLPVAIEAVADRPTLEVAAVAGAEDSPLSLGIKAALADADGSERLTVSVSGLPEGAQLSHGELGDDGAWRLTPAELAEVALLPPENLSGAITLNVEAVAAEETGDRATATASLPVTLTPVADRPTLVLAPAQGVEDQALALSIEAGLADLDGSERLMIMLEGLPEGFRLSAGAQSGPGEPWVLSPDQLDSLALIGAENASGAFTLAVTAAAQEIDREQLASNAQTLEVRIDPRPDAPRLEVSDQEALEDGAVGLDIEAGLIDLDGSESLSLEISGLPAGASLSAGRAEAGIWRLTGEDLPQLSLLPPEHFSGQIPLSIKALAVEADGEAAATEQQMTVTVRGVADQLSVTTENARGPANGPIALRIEAGSEDADGSETLTVEIAGLPEGATLNKGEARSGGRWSLPAAELSGLTLLPGAGASGRIPLDVTVRAEEADGDSSSTATTLVLELLALTDTIALEVDDAVGREDEAVPLNIAIQHKDGDPAGQTPIFVGGLAEGAALSAGVEEESGQWRVEPQQLAGLELFTPSDFSGAMTLAIIAGAEDQARGERPSASLSVVVSPVADPPELTVSEAQGLAGSPLRLEIAAALSDLDGSETLSIEISGLPEGAGLNAGSPDGDGTWRLTAGDLEKLELLPPEDYSGRFDLSVVASAREAEGPAAEARTRLPVRLAALAATVPVPAVTIPIEPIEQPSAPEQPAPEAAAPRPAAPEASSEAVPVLGAQSDPAAAKLGNAAPAAVTPLPAALAPSDQAESGPSNEWIERGDRLLSLGDIAAARLFYELAVQQGNAKAATAMGRTYDPTFLRERDVIGIPGNPTLATQWYQRAIDAGDPDAKLLMDALPQ